MLHFLTEEQLNNEFENQGFRIPLPIKGAHRIKDLQVFKALSRALEQALRAQDLHRTDPTLHDFQVSLQLGIALRAVIQLTRHEPRSQRIMQETPDGLAYFSVGEERYGAWIEWKDGHISAGKHQPDRQPDVSVRFNNPETALKAVGNRIDVMAAIGMGQIQVTGLVPLADALGYIFERIPLYINHEPATLTNSGSTAAFESTFRACQSGHPRRHLRACRTRGNRTGRLPLFRATRRGGPLLGCGWQ